MTSSASAIKSEIAGKCLPRILLLFLVKQFGGLLRIEDVSNYSIYRALKFTAHPSHKITVFGSEFQSLISETRVSCEYYY